MKRPDPAKRRAAYHRWRRARVKLNKAWKLKDTQ